MSLAPGARIGPYEILAPIGAGGMGEVYSARDTKLNREVAIKALPDELAADGERVARFEREAHLLASLNHPNIATLHGLEESNGLKYLVMELVPGETLAERISRGPIRIDECLGIFRQIAEALEAAHEKGIIHRDLKPANIIVSSDGRVKVLDFGLAKSVEVDAQGSDSSSSPTRTREGTELGVILGTAAYMSPEQARGKPVDKRTDIWAFGCCLFEALTGRAAFLGETVTDTLVRILEREPAWSALPGRTPSGIRRLLARCLTKDPGVRLHDIADARIEVVVADSESEATVERGSRDRRAILVVGALAVVTTALTLWRVTRSHEPVARPVIRSILPLPQGERLTLDYMSDPLAISPDGRYVVYESGSDESLRLNVQRLDALQASPIEGSEGATTPFFSPDGESIGFVKDRIFFRAAVSGGGPRRVSEVGGNTRGVDWSGDGLVYAKDVSTGLFRVPAAGGEPQVLTVLDRDRRENSHRFPQVLPGGDAVLFTLATSTTDSWDDASIAVASMKTGQYKVVLEGGTHARFSLTGHLIYARRGTLHAVTFDLGRLEVTGLPVPVVPQVMTSSVNGSAAFALAQDGSLVYAPGLSRTEDRRVVSVDRQGRVEPLVEPPKPFGALRLSPDGRHLALHGLECTDDIWLYDMARQTLTRWTSEWSNAVPVWDPSGRSIAFTSARDSAYNLYRQALDTPAQPVRLATGDYHQIPASWSPDGAVLAFHQDGVGSTDIWMLSLSGGRGPEVFLNGRANEMWPAFSPDGRWVAYESDETGRFEIYARRFPDGNGMRQISTGGGSYAVWNPNGKELFYRSGNKMMAVVVETEGDLVLGLPNALFERHYPQAGFATFTVTPDGQRFIDLDDSVAEPAPTHLVLVQNFSEELKRLVPRSK